MKCAATAPPSLITLILLTGLSVLSLNMFLPSLANIADEFQADFTLVSLSIAGYLAATAVLQLVIGPLSDRFGRRPVLLSGLVIFIIGSLGCLLAEDIWSFLIFRLIQGAIISGSVLSRAAIRDSAPEQETASMIGYVSMAMAVAPMLGPMVGGLLDELFGWRSSFILFTSLGIIVLGQCWFDFGETNTNPSETFSRQFRSYPDLFRSRRFWGYALCIMFSVGAFYVFLAGVPLIADKVFEMSPAVLGFFMGTITAGFMAGSFVSGRLSRRYSLTKMMIAGRIIACGGLIAGLILFLSGFVHVLIVFLATACVGVGNGITLPSANAGALSVRRQLAGSASGLVGALMVGGGALLIPLAGIVLSGGGGAAHLLGMMLLCSLMALLAALYVLRIDRHEGRHPSSDSIS